MLFTETAQYKMNKLHKRNSAKNIRISFSRLLKYNTDSGLIEDIGNWKLDARYLHVNT